MTNGDAVRAMTNEEIAKLVASDRMVIFHTIQKKFGTDFDFDALNHAMYCVLLEWLNREADDAETAT